MSSPEPNTLGTITVIAQLSKSEAVNDTMVKSPDTGAIIPGLKSHLYHLNNCETLGKSVSVPEFLQL